MYKSLGLVAMVVFVILASLIGSMSPGFGMVLISFIFVSAGVIAFSLLQFPTPLEGGKIQGLLAFSKLDMKGLTVEVEELSTIIRRDGLLVAEAYRKNLKDKKLQYLIKRSMDGFEKKALMDWIAHHASYQEEQFSLLQGFADRVLMLTPVVGLLGTVLQLMNTPISLSSAFVPFLMALVMQLTAQAVYQEKIIEARRRSKLYFTILSVGVQGIMDGVTAEFIQEQMSAHLGAGT